MSITATIKSSEHTGKISANRKEKNFYSQLSVITKGAGQEIICARFYQTASTSYCCVWVWNTPYQLSGGGKASGYGYHRPSEALQAALGDAGITLDADIGGRGDSAMTDALKAVALAMGQSDIAFINAHA